MIPDNITKKHILKAIAEVDRDGVPPGRGSTRYSLLHDGRLYPPKYTVSVANRFANGNELPSANFSGGKEVNEFLARFGFSIQGGTAKPLAVKPPHRRVAARRHDERCSECKNAIIEMFRALFGSVKVDHKITVSARMEGYASHPRRSDLAEVFRALQAHRGHKGFVRLKQLHRCDLYIPGIDAVVEFDESQHFTAARDVALSHYPRDLSLGFDLQEWRERCRSIDAKDKDPKFRDEQRAWYDSLRDFLPFTKGMSPTIRIYMGEFPWCSLDARKPTDVAAFKKMLSPALPVPARASGSIGTVATVAVSCAGDYTVDGRIELMKEVLQHPRTSADALLFPAGYFASMHTPRTQLPTLIARISELISDCRKNPIVCFGVDGRDSKDQVAAAVNTNGLLGLARKFHPTEEEADYIEAASGPFAKEDECSRIIDIGGKRAFLAVCYDSFGIRHRSLVNPGVDLIFALVHGFKPKGEHGSGDVYFAKHGLAGSSKQWGCPAFGAAVFFNRPVPEAWPSGVMWNQRNKSTQRWKYSDNPLQPVDDFKVFHGKDTAVVRVYQVQDIPMIRAANKTLNRTRTSRAG